MKIAVSAWNGKIAPLFDVSRQIELMEAKDGEIISRQVHNIEANDVMAKINKLTELGVNVLICGAISRPLADMVAGRGIKLMPFVSGEVAQIADAYLTGNLSDETFAMPGCCGRRRRRGWFFGGRPGGGCFGGRRMPMRRSIL